jgi:hypothetical protein
LKAAGAGATVRKVERDDEDGRQVFKFDIAVGNGTRKISVDRETAGSSRTRRTPTPTPTAESLPRGPRWKIGADRIETVRGAGYRLVST